MSNRDKEVEDDLDNQPEVIRFNKSESYAVKNSDDDDDDDDGGEEGEVVGSKEEIRYAGFKARLNANFIDSLIMLPIIYYAIVILFPAKPLKDNILEQRERLLIEAQEKGLSFIEAFQLLYREGAIELHLMSNLSIIIVMGIFTASFWFYKSATPGKMLLGMKIVDAATLQDPTKIQLILRYIGYIISAIPFMMGFFWIAFNKKKQGWHDLISKTMVIYTKPLDKDWKEKRFKRQTYMVVAFLLIWFIFYYNN